MATPILVIDREPEEPSYVFLSPRKVLTTSAPEEVPTILGQLDEERQAGMTVAGFLSYEALDEMHGIVARDPSRERSSLPLLWFGCYEKPHQEFFFRENSGRDFALRVFPGEGELLPEEEHEFHTAVHRIKSHLLAGECYQVNYTRRRRYGFEGDPLGLYSYLRRLQPTKHSVFLKTDDFSILSFSPELFFELQTKNGICQIHTRPMKGTAPRGRNRSLDKAALEQLKTDSKTRAENVMIVDLLRNDMGVHAIPGSVEVSRLFALETHPTLHQMTSHIQANLTPALRDNFFARVLPDLFPSGSITGAPRRRVRQIIQTLEHSERGVYTGMIGFATLESARFNVAIRTLSIADGRADYGSGCGIVWDSEPDEEWREYNLKAAFLRPAFAGFHLIESLRATPDGIPLWPWHRQRLQRSAERFHMAVDLARLEQEVGMHLPAEGAARVRIALYRNEIKIESTPLSDEPGEILIGQATDRIWSADPFRAYKTSERSLYDDWFARRGQEACDDFFFINERGEIVETCIGNLVFRDREQGRWLTPAPECGALPGVWMAKHSERHSIQPVRVGVGEARRWEWFVANAVRGLRRAYVEGIHDQLTRKKDGPGSARPDSGKL